MQSVLKAVLCPVKYLSFPIEVSNIDFDTNRRVSMISIAIIACFARYLPVCRVYPVGPFHPVDQEGLLDLDHLCRREDLKETKTLGLVLIQGGMECESL